MVNNGECEEEAGNHRILRILDWIDHIKSMGTSCVLFNPLFESDAHGYDTRNYNKVDRRLGTNEDFKKVCDAIHASGMKVMLDGVFNHAGRGFFAFEDVRQKKWDSRYKDWNDMLCGIPKEKEEVGKVTTYGNKTWNDATDNRDKTLLSLIHI